jgi:lipopolysaccharide cholinephosphotransferase
VRHGGFVPWDDDMDITMMEKDRKRLLPYLKKELPDYLQISTISGFYTISDTRETIDFYDSVTNKTFKDYASLDIFGLEKGTKWFKKITNMFCGRVNRVVVRKDVRNDYELILGHIFYPFSLLLVWTVRLLCIFVSNNSLVLSYDTAIYNSTLTKRKDAVFPLRAIQFEKMEFPAPHDVDTYLKMLYGDYMKIPPESKRYISRARYLVNKEKQI